MTSGRYSVVRCIPDAARGEMFNIGIAIWARGRFQVEIDHSAARRAAKENPHFAIDALDHLKEVICAQLQTLDPINTTKFQKMRKSHRGIPFLFSEPQFVNVPSNAIDPLAEPLDKLIERVIKTKRPREEKSVNPADLLQDKVLGLISTGKVLRNHSIVGKKTGYHRHFDFAVAKTVIDVLRLDIQDRETAISRADAEAFKILDVADTGEVSEFYVLPFVGDDKSEPNLLEGDPTHKAISSVRGKILVNMDAAEQVIRNAAQAA